MSISDPYTALKYILQNNTEITSLLGKYIDPTTGTKTTIPLIYGGVLDATQTDLPCIGYYNNNMDTNRSIEDSTFTLNCYAGTDRASFLLAKTIVNQLNGGQSFANGYSVTTTCKILGSVPDPQSKEVNTVVEIRLFNLNGGA